MLKVEKWISVHTRQNGLLFGQLFEYQTFGNQTRLYYSNNANVEYSDWDCSWYS